MRERSLPGVCHLAATRRELIAPGEFRAVKAAAGCNGAIGTEIASIDKSIMALHRGCEASRTVGMSSGATADGRLP
jgi:hypothetical protein